MALDLWVLECLLSRSGIWALPSLQIGDLAPAEDDSFTGEYAEPQLLWKGERCSAWPFFFLKYCFLG